MKYFHQYISFGFRKNGTNKTYCLKTETGLPSYQLPHNSGFWWAVEMRESQRSATANMESMSRIQIPAETICVHLAEMPLEKA